MKTLLNMSILIFSLLFFRKKYKFYMKVILSKEHNHILTTLKILSSPTVQKIVFQYTTFIDAFRDYPIETFFSLRELPP